MFLSSNIFISQTSFASHQRRNNRYQGSE